MVHRPTFFGHAKTVQVKVGGSVHSWVLYTFIIVLLFVILLAILPVEVRMHYEHVNGDDSGELQIRYFFGIVHLTRTLSQISIKATDGGPAMQVNGSSETEPGDKQKTVSTNDVMGFLKHFSRWRQIGRELLPVVHQFLTHIRVKQAKVESLVGTGDVIRTSMLVGAAWAILGTFFGFATTHCRFDSPPRIQLAPDFNERSIKVRLAGIFRVKAGYAIIVAIRVFQVLKRRTT